MAIGNALEVQEAAEILQGRGCEDLRGVCMTLAANMVELCNGWDEDFAKQQVHEAVASGKAFEQATKLARFPILPTRSRSISTTPIRRCACRS